MNAEKKLRIYLSKIIGERLESIDDGSKLYFLLQSELKKGMNVELDFSDVKAVLTPFLHASMGKLLMPFGKETLMSRLVLCNISADQLKRVNLYLDGTEKKHNQESTHDMMTELFEEDEMGDSIA